jgi:Domain of unknown function (DUF6378)
VNGGKDIHGPVGDSYAMIAQLWEIYLRHSNYKRHGNPAAGQLSIDAKDVLEMMSLLKKGRDVYSPKMNRENFTDDAGYVALAGMVAQAMEPPPRQLPKVDIDDVEEGIRNIATQFKPRNHV